MVKTHNYDVILLKLVRINLNFGWQRSHRYPSHSSMSLNQLSILKSGLTELNKTVNTCRKELLSWLQKQEMISVEDKEWLDGEANLIDEVAVVELLEKAPNYQDGFATLTSQQRSLVEKLEKLGSEVIKRQSGGNKRKRTSTIPPCYFQDSYTVTQAMMRVVRLPRRQIRCQSLQRRKMPHCSSASRL